MRRIGCIVVILIIAAVGFAAWVRVQNAKARTRGVKPAVAVPVEVTRLAPSDLLVGAEVTGNVATDEKVDLAAKLGGRVAFVAAREGQAVRAGQVVVRLENSDFVAQVEQARAALQAAQARLPQAVTAAQMQTTKSGTDVAQAKAALAAAQAQLAALKAGARPQERKQAESAVTQAQSALENAETNLRRMQDLFAKGAVSQQVLDASRLQYDIARGQRDTAQQQLSLVREGPRQEDIDAAEQRVKQAQQAVIMAEAATGQIEISGLDVRAARAGVAQARAALLAAEVQLANTVVRTPISGVVSKRAIEPGEMAVPGVTLLTVVNNGSVYLRAQLSEGQLSRVRVGAPATVEVDAAGGGPIAAQVAEVLPSANQGNLTFTVKIPLSNGQGLLKDGMFGRGKIVTERRRGVLVIPRESAVTQAGQTLVFVVENGKARAVPVTLGLTEDDRVEVTSGLRAGDQVVVRGQDTLSGEERVAVQAGGGR